MALTTEEETKVRALITAFDGGKRISDLPQADTSNPSEYLIEGEAKSTGESVKVPLAEAITVANGRVACRRWNRTQSTPVGTAYGNIEALRSLPSDLGLGCYLVQNDRTRRKLDPTNHYRFADGSPAALDGTMGHYMWCWNDHYYAWWVDGDYYYEAVSLSPIAGKLNYHIPAGGVSALGGGVMDRTTSTLVSVVSDDVRYRGGNNNADKDGKFNTLCGKVATQMNAAAFGTAARKNGEGWEAGWFVANAVEGYLFRLIMGTRHVQAAFNASKDADGLYQGGLGSGVTGVSSAAGQWWNDDYGLYPFVPTSAGVELGDDVGISDYAVKGSDGEAVFTAKVPVFFGLKNFYGHIGRIERGSLINKLSDGSGEYYVAPSLYDTFDNSTVSGLIKAATVPKNDPAGWKYIKELSMQNLCCAPTVATASESTYYCDGWYNDNATSGLRCPFRRGYASYGGVAGLACLFGSFAVSRAYAYWSSPLCYFADDVSPVPEQF